MLHPLHCGLFALFCVHVGCVGVAQLWRQQNLQAEKLDKMLMQPGHYVFIEYRPQTLLLLAGASHAQSRQILNAAKLENERMCLPFSMFYLAYYAITIFPVLVAVEY